MASPHGILPLALRDLRFAAGGRSIIHGISAEFGPGPATILLGANGAGKSVLMLLMHGLLQPSAGAIVWRESDARRIRRGQAVVFQRPILLRRLAVNGYVEVLRHLPELLWIRSRITHYFLQERPRVFVGIDAPDFNFTLEAKLKQAGIPTVHFVSPSIWEWRPERIHRIKQAVSHMLVVFPFEEKIYQDAGVPVSYVGHPLADVIPLQPDMAAARAVLGLTSSPVIALLPGSRLSEVARHARLMLDAAVRIGQHHPGAQFVLPAASEAAAQLIRQAAHGLEFPLHILTGQSHTALAACDVALVASGTATLEAALFKKPMVITYRLPELTAYLVRKKLLLPWIGLPNILFVQIDPWGS